MANIIKKKLFGWHTKEEKNLQLKKKKKCPKQTHVQNLPL